ncbi:MAG: hypothetical protein GF329_05530 [Candidatus Lokiarchaeota archaeon]|nr:hypothetical protein [Candidatus Lokiarchaeota archaeon]
MKRYSKEIVKQIIDSTIYTHLNKYIIEEIVNNKKFNLEILVNDIVVDLIDNKEIISPNYRSILKDIISMEIKNNYQTII